MTQQSLPDEKTPPPRRGTNTKPVCQCAAIVADWPPEERDALISTKGAHAEGCPLRGAEKPAEEPAAAAQSKPEEVKQPAEVKPAPTVLAGPMKGTPTPAAAKQAAQEGAGIAFRASRGPKAAPLRFCVYGPRGVGKTQFLADMPDATIIPLESGSESFDVSRVDEPTPRTFAELMRAIEGLTVDPVPMIGFKPKTVAIDTADAVEAMICRAVIARHNKQPDKKREAVTLDDVGYRDAGLNAAQDLWRQLLAALERLRNVQGCHIAFACHAEIVKVNNLGGENYDRHTLHLHEKIGRGLLGDWVDELYFATYDVRTAKVGKRGPVRGVGGKERILIAQHSAIVDAKTRHDLPPTMPLEWGAVWEVIERNRQPVALRAAIGKLVEQLEGVTFLDPTTNEERAFGDWVAAQLAGDPPVKRLAQIKNRLAQRVQEIAEARAAEEAERVESGTAASAAGYDE